MLIAVKFRRTGKGARVVALRHEICDENTADGLAWLRGHRAALAGRHVAGSDERVW
jgi:hypothetical protein